MKIALAQINYHIGHFESNQRKMIAKIEAAKARGADLVCFAELSVCGYPPRDFLEFEGFMEECRRVIDALADAARGIAVVVGAPSPNPIPEGKALFNAAWFLHEGKVVARRKKALLPTYDVFDEYRYFERGTNFEVVEWKGKRIALTICEDIWDVPTGELKEEDFDPMYTLRPLDKMQDQNPDFIINISASPFSFEQAQTRMDILKANGKRYGIPLFYVNHVGAQTELIFDGGSTVVDGQGRIYDEMPYFSEGLSVYDTDQIKEAPRDQERPKQKMKLIHEALVCGIRDYFQKLGFSSAIIGLSGGIDSALTTVLAAEALGIDNVRVVLMPSRFSSDHSVSDSEDLAKNLGIRYDIVPIHKPYDAFIQELHPLFENKPFDIAEENMQSRCRGLILMALSNKFGNILLNTTNKSEMAVGYGTLYGDLAGGLSILGDVYKSEVYALAKWINQDAEIIPQNIIEKPPSAELRPDQKDTDSLPEYDLLDRILYQYIEKRRDPKMIIDQGFDEKIVRRVIRLVNINEFKRHQTAPVLRVSTKAFGMGRRMPIVARYLS
ncbi:MAG: NAD+ synthase [Bacteroidetes bacterium]|jgi:NAD+ synthase (glutamine-hydrolysing)|nr:NAD+ synthase [Bacteroidota bacterium]